MAEKTRVRCPFCGQLPDAEFLDKDDVSAPAVVRIVLQRFGGKAAVVPVPGEPYVKKGRGGAKGFMEYEDITNQVPEVVEKYQEFFDKRVDKYGGGK